MMYIPLVISSTNLGHGACHLNSFGTDCLANFTTLLIPRDLMSLFGPEKSGSSPDKLVSIVQEVSVKYIHTLYIHFNYTNIYWEPYKCKTLC